MIIENFKHKALRRYFEDGIAKGLDSKAVVRLGRMLAFIDAAGSVDVLEIPPNFGFHRLTGNRAGSAALVVTRNWRMTFVIVDATTIADLDLEDYH